MRSFSSPKPPEEFSSEQINNIIIKVTDRFFIHHQTLNTPDHHKRIVRRRKNNKTRGRNLSENKQFRTVRRSTAWPPQLPNLNRRGGTEDKHKPVRPPNNITPLESPPWPKLEETTTKHTSPILEGVDTHMNTKGTYFIPSNLSGNQSNLLCSAPGSEAELDEAWGCNKTVKTALVQANTSHTFFPPNEVRLSATCETPSLLLVTTLMGFLRLCRNRRRSPITNHRWAVCRGGKGPGVATNSHRPWIRSVISDAKINNRWVTAHKHA
ncbi:hypothetical protein RRG08_010073 [Elysia crispata]|uniref:Uncharacterized protein n=1 Tax=Elysia crispata TaxID=231223 RepID=A0AAE1ED07_9GAST|nr:hypothetical protein RRG08_010073 [Elysia crispata]